MFINIKPCLAVIVVGICFRQGIDVRPRTYAHLRQTFRPVGGIVVIRLTARDFFHALLQGIVRVVGVLVLRFAVDFRRQRVAAFKEQSTYSSVQFLDMLVKTFPFQIECIQTDNGLEFIKEFKKRKCRALVLRFIKTFLPLGGRTVFSEPVKASYRGVLSKIIFMPFLPFSSRSARKR